MSLKSKISNNWVLDQINHEDCPYWFDGSNQRYDGIGEYWVPDFYYCKWCTKIVFGEIKQKHHEVIFIEQGLDRLKGIINFMKYHGELK